MVGGLSWGYVGPSWGNVGPSWGYVGPSWGYVGPSWGYVCPSWGLCCPILGLCWPILRPMLAHVDPPWATGSEKWEKKGWAKYPVKRRIFWRGGVVGGRGGGPSLLRRGEKRRTAMPRPGGPWPDLSAYARQPARGPTMLAHRVAICWPMLAYVGLSCGQRGPILWLGWPMFASCWPMLSQKIRKMGTAKKRCKTQDIWWSAAYLGAMLAHLGAMLAHFEGNVGPSWGYVGPSWGYVGPSWGYVGPSWGLCWR